MEEDIEYTSAILTPDELRALYDYSIKGETDPVNYDTTVYRDDKTGLYYVKHSFAHATNPAYDHLMAEELYARREEVDWRRTTNCYDYQEIERLSSLISRPLMWVDGPVPTTNSITLLDALAAEIDIDDESDEYERNLLFGDLLSEGILWFADHLPMRKDLVYPRARYCYVPKDMVLWDRLMIGGCTYDYSRGIMNGRAVFTPNARELRRNLEDIATHRGGARAAEILEMLREDWPDIVAMKLFGTDKMTREEVEDLRVGIFEAMNRALRSWKAEPQKQAPAPSRYSKYIVAERFTEIYKGQDYTIEDYENTLHDAAKGSAKHFAGVLENGLKAGILNAHGDGKKAILAYFKDRFPDMTTYSYQYFSDVFTLPN